MNNKIQFIKALRTLRRQKRGAAIMLPYENASIKACKNQMEEYEKSLPNEAIELFDYFIEKNIELSNYFIEKNEEITLLKSLFLKREAEVVSLKEELTKEKAGPTHYVDAKWAVRLFRRGIELSSDEEVGKLLKIL